MPMHIYARFVCIFLMLMFLLALHVSADTDALATGTVASTTSEQGARNQRIQNLAESKDLTKPEEDKEKEAIFQLLEKRPVEKPGLLTFGAWWVQNSIRVGIPANTIVLILLLPLLAALVVFIRVVIGLPSLEMLVPIALAYVFVAVGVVIGSIILATVVAASFISRMLLRKISLMYYPKRSLSMLLLALFVFGALTASIELGIGNVEDLSIFPILILTLLGDSIVSVQLRKSMRESLVITLVTIALGLFGYWLAVLDGVRNMLILYPEFVLLSIPINIAMGRYFGLRLSEVFRFRSFSAYGSE
jgi:hypothetical protein